MANLRQSNIHDIGRNKQSFTSQNRSAKRSPTTTMLITDSPPVTTDQYHHTETIWRVLLDIISLAICKKNKRINSYFTF